MSDSTFMFPNKIIPIVLAGLIVVSILLVLMQIGKVSTVHQSILSQIGSTNELNINVAHLHDVFGSSLEPAEAIFFVTYQGATVSLSSTDIQLTEIEDTGNLMPSLPLNPTEIGSTNVFRVSQEPINHWQHDDRYTVVVEVTDPANPLRKGKKVLSFMAEGPENSLAYPQSLPGLGYWIDQFNRDKVETTNAPDLYKPQAVGGAGVAPAQDGNRFVLRLSTGGLSPREAIIGTQDVFKTKVGETALNLPEIQVVVVARLGSTNDLDQQLVNLGVQDGNTIQPITGTNEMIMFVYDVTATSGNWQCRTANGLTGSTVDTGVAADTSYHVFSITWKVASVNFLIDGITRCTITTNIPDLPINFMAGIQNKEALDKQLSIDSLEIVLG